MRAFWKKNSVISLKLEENLFSLVQMIDDSAFMRFYDIFREKDEWSGVDLNEVSTAFYGPVGRILIQRLGVRRIPSSEVKPSEIPFERYFIDVCDNADGYRLRGEYMWRGGKLIDMGENAEEDLPNAPAVIPHLKLPDHREQILKYELTNFWGDKDTAARLIHLHKTGINRNGIKEAVFPELYTNDNRADKDTDTYRAIWAPYEDFLQKAKARIATQKS